VVHARNERTNDSSGQPQSDNERHWLSKWCWAQEDKTVAVVVAVVLMVVVVVVVVVAMVVVIMAHHSSGQLQSDNERHWLSKWC